jgi:toxin ParE1/3/4
LVEINWTREAELWLRDIYNYIALDNNDVAEQTVVGIFQTVQLLTKHPRLGRRYGPERSREVRVLLCGHYRIAYLIESDNQIDILGIFHDALNIERYLL